MPETVRSMKGLEHMDVLQDNKVLASFEFELELRSEIAPPPVHRELAIQPEARAVVEAATSDARASSHCVRRRDRKGFASHVLREGAIHF